MKTKQYFVCRWNALGGYVRYPPVLTGVLKSRCTGADQCDWYSRWTNRTGVPNQGYI